MNIVEPPPHVTVSKKQTPAHIDFLDYFRGVAVLSIFIYHSLWPAFGIFNPSWVGWYRDMNVDAAFLSVLPASFGAIGVPIFFALSGFCIHLSHVRSREKGFKVFFLRRFFRIYPPYLLALGFAALFNVAIHDDPLRYEIHQFVPHVLLLQNFDDYYFYQINGAFWSIAVEVQLYILYPVLLWLVSRLGWQKTLWITAGIELGLRSIQATTFITYSPWEPSRLITGIPFYFWFSWAMGAALADAYLKGAPLPFRGVQCILWPVLFFAAYFFRPMFPYFFTLAALCTTCLISVMLSRPTLEVRPTDWGKYALLHLRWAGIVSYSAYLIHLPFVNHLNNALAYLFPGYTFPSLVTFGICLLLWFPIFGLSYLFYRYVEQPSIAYGKRVIARTRNAAVPVPTFERGLPK